VTDITSSSIFTKSIGSIFSTINKSVSSAFNSLMPAAEAGGQPTADSGLQMGPHPSLPVGAGLSTGIAISEHPLQQAGYPAGAFPSGTNVPMSSSIGVHPTFGPTSHPGLHPEPTMQEDTSTRLGNNVDMSENYRQNPVSGLRSMCTCTVLNI